MSKNYLTVVYEIDETTTAQAVLGAHPWTASSHSHAIHERDAARLEIASLHAQMDAVGAGGMEPLRKRECLHKIIEPAQAPIQRPVFGLPGTRDVDVAAPAKVLAGVIELAKAAHAHWDADRDAKVGKILMAMAGWNEGYDWRADALHAAAASPQPAAQATPIKIKPLQWSEERQPNEDIRYNHVVADSPIGRFSIEWKGWKKYDSRDLCLDREPIGPIASTLDEAKAFAAQHLQTLVERLVETPQPAAQAAPAEITDDMALAFHRAYDDCAIWQDDVDVIKVGLRAALVNFTIGAQAAPVDAAVLQDADRVAQEGSDVR